MPFRLLLPLALLVAALPAAAQITTSTTPGGPVYTWLDPSGGTRVDLDDDDETTVPFPFTVSLGGSTFDSLFVSSNGAARLPDDPDATIGFSNGPLDETGYPFFLAPFWDDLYPADAPTSGVSWKTVGSAPDRVFVLTWVRAHIDAEDDADTLAFQVHVREGAPYVEYHYRDVYGGEEGGGGEPGPGDRGGLSPFDRGGSATVGAIFGGTPYAFSYDTPSLDDGFALRITPAVPPGPPVVFVDGDATGAGDGSSWEDAFPTLRAGLAAAEPGAEVWVAEGTYYPDEGPGATDGDRAASFLMPPDVGVYGGFAGTETARHERDWTLHPTVLSGDVDGDGTPAGNSVHVVRSRDQGPDSNSPPADAGTLDGVVVTGGNADGDGFEGGGGAGVYLRYARMTLRNSRITRNTAGFTGAGVLVDQNGQSTGGVETASVTVINTLFDNNTANYGSGLRTWFGSAYVTHSTFAGNSGVQGCAAFISDLGNSDSFVRNTVAWENPCVVDGPDVDGTNFTTGGSVIDGDGSSLDPLLHDPLTDRFDLLIGSPAEDAGDAEALPADADDLDGDGVTEEPYPFDLAGNPRVAGEAPDAGAFEGTAPFVALRYRGAEGWRMIVAPAPGLTLDDVVGPEWTQGYPGADYSGGLANVYRYDETVTTDANGDGTADLIDGYVPPTSQSEGLPPGTGRWIYVYGNVTPGAPTPGGDLPRTTLIPVTPGAVTAFTFTPLLTATPSDGGSLDVLNDGWNMVGNPFEVGMDWDAEGWTKTGVSNAIHVYDPAFGGGSYRVWNGEVGDLPGGVVGAGQAFWVHALTASPALAAASDARTTGRQVYGRSPASVVEFRLAGTVGGAPLTRTFYLNPRADALAGLDAFDAPALTPPVPSYLALGSVIDVPGHPGVRLAIDARPGPEDGAPAPIEIPLAVDAVANGASVGADLVLTWPQITGVPASWALALVDDVTGERVDLRGASSYAFTHTPATGPRAAEAVAPGPLSLGRATTAAAPRFRLVVTPSGVVATTPEGGPALALDAPRPNPVVGDARVGYTLPAAGPVRLALYDVLGREVAVLLEGTEGAGRHEATIPTAGLPAGLYVLRLDADGRALTRRLTVNR